MTMFDLINQTHEKKIKRFVKQIEIANLAKVSQNLEKIIQQIYDDIPLKKRISYGRYSVIKKLGLFTYPFLDEKKIDIYRLALYLFSEQKHDPFLRSLGMQFLSLLAEKNNKNLNKVILLFEKAAIDESWEVRECSAGFIRKLIKAYPDQIHKWYLKMALAKNDKQRRFAIESLRPVADNSWFKKKPDFAFSILKLLYKEPATYPRTAVGNSLSDWMRIDEEKTLKIVKNLAKNGDKNSYWIAYRACRNLVKKKPILVMDLLKIDHYKYKDRSFSRQQG